MPRIGRGSPAGVGSGLPAGTGPGFQQPTSRDCFPIYKVRGNLPCPPASARIAEGAYERTERPTEPLPSGGAGRGVRAERDGESCPSPDWQGIRGQARRAVRTAAERAARRPRGSHEQRRRGPTAARSWAPCSRSPAAPRFHPALTMSICCCFFFRDYGSSKRKSGKGDSGRFPLQPPPASCTRLSDSA